MLNQSDYVARPDTRGVSAYARNIRERLTIDFSASQIPLAGVRLHSKRPPCSPRGRCMARMALSQGELWLALPHPRLMPTSRSWWRATFCARGRQAPMAKSGRRAHLAQVEDCKSDVRDYSLLQWTKTTRAWLRGQPTRWSTGASAGPLSACAGPHLLPGCVRPSVGLGM